MSRPDTTATRLRMIDLIDSSLRCAQGLMIVLDDERQALEKQDMDALQPVIDDKGRSVDELRGLEEQRRHLCITCGFEDGPEQMANVLKWCDADDAIADSWQHLMHVATECNLRNATNGAIISGRKHQIESSISVLRGGAATNDTYSRSGRTPGGTNLRTIAEA